MTSREQEVFLLLRDDPMLPQQAIATRLGMSRSAVAGHIMNLTNKGLIKGRGYVLHDAPFVAVIGGANIDIHGKSSNALRASDSNPGTVHTSAGGVARNVAENLARLGLDSRLISVVGDDYHGKMLLRLCRDAGIDTQFVHEIASAATSTYLSVVDESGDMHVAIADMDIVAHLDVPRLLPRQAMLQLASLIVLDCNLSNETLTWLCSTFEDKPIFVDTVSSTKAVRIRSCLKSVHTLKTSTIEVEALFGLQATTQTQLDKVASWLHEEGVKRVLITRGDKGVFFSDGVTQGALTMQRYDRQIQNAGGAGDAFLAGLACAWLEQRDLTESVRFALAAADITLSHPATNSPALTLDAVNALMEAHHAG